MLSQAKINAVIEKENAKLSASPDLDLAAMFKSAEDIKNKLYQAVYDKVIEENKRVKELSPFADKSQTLPKFTSKLTELPINNLDKPRPLEPGMYNNNPPGQGFVMRKNV